MSSMQRKCTHMETFSPCTKINQKWVATCYQTVIFHCILSEENKFLSEIICVQVGIWIDKIALCKAPNMGFRIVNISEHTLNAIQLHATKIKFLSQSTTHLTLWQQESLGKFANFKMTQYFHQHLPSILISPNRRNAAHFSFVSILCFSNVIRIWWADLQAERRSSFPAINANKC